MRAHATTPVLLTALLFASTGSQSLAQFSGSDNFNDNSRDPSKWSIEASRLNEDNGRLEFTSTGSGDEDDTWVWVANEGSQTRDWSVTITAVNTATPAIGRFCGMGLFVVNSADEDNDSFGVLLATDGEAGRLVGSLWETDGVESEAWEPLTPSTATLRISYDASTGELSSEYDTGGGYSSVTSFDVSNWSMGPSDTFYVALLGMSGNSFAVSSGQMYVDNFEAATVSEISSHLNFVILEHVHDFKNPVLSSDDRYDFMVDAETDDSVSSVELITPGNETIALTIYYDDYGYRWWEYNTSSPTSLSSRFADGDYMVELTYEDFTTESTVIPFAVADGTTPVANVTMQPQFIAPAPLQDAFFVDSMPITFKWAAIDANANVISIVRVQGDDREELGWFSDISLPADGPLSTRSVGPISFTQGVWQVEFYFGNGIETTNMDGIYYIVAKETESDYEFTVLEAADDEDGDGQSNLQEYIAGMDPTDSNSVFRITNNIPLGDDFVIEWPSVSGRVYSALWTTNLMTGFQPLESDIEFPRNSCTDTVHGAERQCFYQMEVQLTDTDNGGIPELAGTAWTEDENSDSTVTFGTDGTSFRVVDQSDGTDFTGTCTPTGPNTYTMSGSFYDGPTHIEMTGIATLSGANMIVNVTTYVDGNFYESATLSFTQSNGHRFPDGSTAHSGAPIS